MLNPSRTLVIWLAFLAVGLLVLGLATDVGLFGWALAGLVGLYLMGVAITRHTRSRAT